MFETGVRQFRMAMSMVWGRRLDPRNVERLIADARATLAEFGAPGPDAMQLVDGPFADPAVRREFADRALRRTARRLVRTSPFYAERFAAAGVSADAVTVDTLPTVPVTGKADLVDRPRDFLCTDVTPYLATRTTGTTGRPAEVWLSRYESELWPAMAALSGLLRDEINPADCMQVNISSRATAAVQQNVVLCRLVGARSRVLGVLPPDESLDALLDPAGGPAGPAGAAGPAGTGGSGGAGGEGAATLLATYPSYLAELVVAARRRGLGPRDFRLRRIDVGGEVLSPALADAARATFGVPRVNDTFGMTEVLPVSGRSCAAGHLHHDINMGLAEVVDLDTGEPAAAGQLGTVVITPYFPYRDCMPVFRYDTRDVVRRLPDAPLDCELAGMPGTSGILGKAGELIRLDPAGAGPVVTPRELLEAYEALPTQPWPARFRVTVESGQLQLTVPESALHGLGVAAGQAHFAGFGLDVRLHPVPVDPADPAAARALRPVRADLVETTFAAAPALAGV